MTEREFWLVIRSALIMCVKAIERRYLAGTSNQTPVPRFEGVGDV